MSHPYEFFTELSQAISGPKSDLPTRARVVGDRWLNQFWRPELLVDFTRELDAAGASKTAMTVRLNLFLSNPTSPSGMPRLWIYDLLGDESKVETGLAQTAGLVGHAIATLRGPNQDAQKVIAEYFGEFPDKVPGQFEGIRNALTQKTIFVMKGDKAEHSLAYVQERDDNLALDAVKDKVPKHRYDSWTKKHRGGDIGFVSVKDRLFASSPSAARGGVETTVPRPPEEQASRVGTTLLHELSHLFAQEKTEDIPAAKVNDKSIAKVLENFSNRNSMGKKLKFSSKGGECYGRIMCKALALSNGFLAVQNADNLTFFALDIWLLGKKGMTADEILKLP